MYYTYCHPIRIVCKEQRGIDFSACLKFLITNLLALKINLVKVEKKQR